MSEKPSEPAVEDAPAELSPAKKRRLKLAYTHGMKMAQSGNYDYAVDMFCQCVAGDPSNVDYIKQLTNTLHKKYGDNKKGDKMAGMKTMGPKATVKKCSVKKDWKGLFKPALEVLKVNPWDVPTLLELASACEHLNHEECELAWLRAALDFDMKDPNINKRAGEALERQKHYDQAIMCWRRVEQAQPENEEARKKIGQLSVERTINKGGLDSAEKASQTKTNLNDPDKKDGLADNRDSSGGGQAPEGERKSQEELALDSIKENPADAGSYLHLSELYLSKDKYEEAENILKKGLEAVPGDFSIVERLEDVQVERRQKQLETAKQKYQKQPTDENKLVIQKQRNELNKFELDVFRSRSDRQPEDATLAAELGLRLERCGQFKEAITAYQRARNDAEVKGQVLMGLARAFVQIKQVKLGMNHLVEACEVIPDSDADNKKEALYLAGKLALQIGDAEKANAYLGQLAGIDFGYKDVSDLLDKLNEMDDTD